MPNPPPSRPNPAVMAVVIIGIVGALTTWSLAPVLLAPFMVLMLAVAVVITIVQNKRQAKPRCPHCGYDLGGLPRDTIKCPECGRLLSGL